MADSRGFNVRYPANAVQVARYDRRVALPELPVGAQRLTNSERLRSSAASALRDTGLPPFSVPGVMRV